MDVYLILTVSIGTKGCVNAQNECIRNDMFMHDDSRWR